MNLSATLCRLIVHVPIKIKLKNFVQSESLQYIVIASTV